MKNKSKNRNEIKKEKEIAKKEFDSILSNKSDALSDKRVSFTALNNLKLKGTLELTDNIRNAALDLEKKITLNINNEEKKFSAQVRKGETKEKELEKSAESVNSDSRELSHSALNANNTEISSMLNNASSEIKKDEEWLKKVKGEWERERKNSIQKNNQIKGEVRNLRLNNKYSGFSWDPIAQPKPGERIEVDEKGRRLKKYFGSETHWPKIVKVQEFGQSHNEQEKELKNRDEKIKDFFNSINKSEEKNG